MWRRHFGGFVLALAVGLATGPAGAEPPSSSATSLPILQRFLTIDAPSPSEYRALRHLDAQIEHSDRKAWMDVWTEGDQVGGFRYQIVGEGGSEYIRSKVFRASLEAEQKMWASGAPDRAALTPDNYKFEGHDVLSDGLASVGMKPRRKDVLLVDGFMFLRSDDGDLVRMEGKLSKSPSFWIRRVEIVRWYQRFAGVRMPVALESVAKVFLAGRATFKMSYEYETVNGERVGSPQPRTLTADAGRP